MIFWISCLIGSIFEYEVLMNQIWRTWHALGWLVNLGLVRREHFAFFLWVEGWITNEGYRQATVNVLTSMRNSSPSLLMKVDCSTCGKTWWSSSWPFNFLPSSTPPLSYVNLWKLSHMKVGDSSLLCLWDSCHLFHFIVISTSKSPCTVCSIRKSPRTGVGSSSSITSTVYRHDWITYSNKLKQKEDGHW